MPAIHHARRGSSPEATRGRRTRSPLPIPTSPDPLFPSPTSPHSKRPRYSARGSPRALRPRAVHFDEGDVVTGTHETSHRSKADHPGHGGGSRDGTSDGVLPGGATRAPELSSDFIASH